VAGPKPIPLDLREAQTLRAGCYKLSTSPSGYKLVRLQPETGFLVTKPLSIQFSLFENYAVQLSKWFCERGVLHGTRLCLEVDQDTQNAVLWVADYVYDEQSMLQLVAHCGSELIVDTLTAQPIKLTRE
jgi:hypothetical protein